MAEIHFELILNRLFKCSGQSCELSTNYYTHFSDEKTNMGKNIQFAQDFASSKKQHWNQNPSLFNSKPRALTQLPVLTNYM